MTQLPLFNDEETPQQPDKKTRPMSIRAKARKIIREEGLYNYAMVIKAVFEADEKHIEAKYNIPKSGLCDLLIREFDMAVGYQESLIDFLHHVKNIPGYGLQKIE